MKQRLISAGVAIAILFVVVFSTPKIIALCAVVLSLMCMYEVFSAFSYQKKPVFVILSVISSVLMPFFDKFDTKFVGPMIFFFVFSLAVYMIFHNKKVNMYDIAMVFFIIIIIPFCFSHIIFLRNAKFGEFYIWLPFIGAFCTDTLAYFVGSFLKGPKLCESISPKKTVSGAIGGFFGSALGFYIYSLILTNIFHININYLPYYLIAIVSAFAGQIGDLTASAIKRLAHTKDFGNIMPGHGGIMDRVDSLMFVAPIIYFVVCVLEIGVFF